MTGLETLDCSTNRLAELTLPKGLDNLKELHLEDNPLTSLTFSEILPNIKGLLISAYYNGPRERESLEALLVYVYPDDRGLLISITLPDDLSNLEMLDINHTGLSSLNLPEGMTSLKELWIYRNELTELEIPEGLTSLRELHLEDNQLTELKISEDLSSLEVLYLYWNQLTELTLPESLSSLGELNLEDNSIERLRVTVRMDIDNLEISGFSKEDITRYTSGTEKALTELYIQLGSDCGLVVFRGGVLQVAESLFEDWKDVPEVIGRYYIDPSESSQKFFRVRLTE